MRKYLIIGNGIAGTTAAEQIRKLDSDGDITLITKELLPLYSRIRLPDYLSGKIDENKLIIKNQEWHSKNNIKLITGVEIKSIDYQGKKVFSQKINIGKADSQKIDIEKTENIFEFDSLLLAVGSKSFIPAIKGRDIDGVMALRTIDDAKVLIKAIKTINSETQINTQTQINSEYKKIKDVVVIGGGLLGLEAAAALIQTGIKVTVIEFFGRLLPRQLDYEGAKRLKLLLENIGITFKLNQVTEEIIGKEFDNQLQGVKLKSGEIIKADAVLFSAGVRPDLSLVRHDLSLICSDLSLIQHNLTSQNGVDITDKGVGTTNKGVSITDKSVSTTDKSVLTTDKGVLINERMETSVPSVYAAGDVAEYQGVNFCIWSEAMEQGRVAGINMAGGNAIYKNITPSNMLKVAGIALASAGEIDIDGKMDSDIILTESVYRKIVKDNNGKVVGCIMIGDTTDFNKIVKQIKGE